MSEAVAKTDLATTAASVAKGERAGPPAPAALPRCHSFLPQIPTCRGHKYRRQLTQARRG